MSFPIIVDYSMSLDEMIKAGNYCFVNPDINRKHFPVDGSGRDQINIELIQYAIPMRSDDDLVRNMKRHGLRPAILPELLAFGASYPEMKGQCIIVALGSVWRPRHHGRLVACLINRGLRRDIDLNPWSHGWADNDQFAAVRT